MEITACISTNNQRNVIRLLNGGVLSVNSCGAVITMANTCCTVSCPEASQAHHAQVAWNGHLYSLCLYIFCLSPLSLFIRSVPPVYRSSCNFSPHVHCVSYTHIYNTLFIP